MDSEKEDENFENTILSFYRNNDWRGILNMDINCYSAKNVRKLMWAWPSEEDLHFIGNLTLERKLNRVVSVGCGCGLFEWLLAQCNGLNVRGVEINESWWTSKYSGTKFIPLHYAKLLPESEIFNNDEALLFCYFNDERAFQKYVSAYQGNLIFIVGPEKGTHIYANPDPINPKFDSQDQWQMIDIKQFKNGINVMSAFEKKKEPQITYP